MRMPPFLPLLLLAASAFAEQREIARFTMNGWRTVVYKEQPAKLPDLPQILKDFDEEIEKTMVVRNRCMNKVDDMIRRHVASDVIKKELDGECKSVETEIRRMVEARDKTYHQAYQMVRNGHSNDRELVQAFADLVKFNPLKKWKCPVDNDMVSLCGEAPGVHGVNVESVEVGGNKRRDIDFKAVRQEALPNFFNKEAWRNYTFTATLRF